MIRTRMLAATVVALLMTGSAHAQMVGGCPGGENARSIDSDEPVRMSFRNGTDETLTAFWIDFDGVRQKYADIAPGERWSVKTFVGHPWAFVTEFGLCVDLHVVNEGEQRYTIR